VARVPALSPGARGVRPAHAAPGAILTVLLAGCTVGPDYRGTHPAMPDHFVEQPAPAASTSPQIVSDDRWWMHFNDPVLNSLEEEALRSAPDLAVAEARIVQARAMRGIAGAAQFPNATAGSEYQRTHGSANVPIGVPPGGLGQGMDSNLWQAGFDASWEIDIFGGVRRGVESANASYEAAVEDRNDAILTLEAEVARNYIEVRSAQRRLDVAREHLDYQRDTLGLTQSLLDAGLASSLDVLRARAEVSDTEAALSTFEVDQRAAAYRIGALIGRTPEALVAELMKVQAIPTAKLDMSIGLPSDLLLRRPDVRAAERRIAAANARIGVAKSDLFPHLSLTGSAGLESLDASGFLNGASHYFSFGPGLSWLIFDAGKVRFRMLAERGRTDEAAAVYQRTVLGALTDVETALVSYAQVSVQREKLAAETSAEVDAVKVATELYKQGVVDFLSVLDLERALLAADDRLSLADRDTALALVALSKALGGGWQARVSDPASASLKR
jgi:outer membrane protein, multidrug efflux system